MMIDKFTIKKNPNKEDYEEISEAVAANDGYCPCMSVKSEDTKCMCHSFRTSDRADFCHCGRYFKVPDLEIVALIGTVHDSMEQWEEIFSKQNFLVIPVKFDPSKLYHHSEGYCDLCKTKIFKADFVITINDENSWVADMVEWAEEIGKKVITRSDLAE